MLDRTRLYDLIYALAAIDGASWQTPRSRSASRAGATGS